MNDDQRSKQPEPGSPADALLKFLGEAIARHLLAAADKPPRAGGGSARAVADQKRRRT